MPRRPRIASDDQSQRLVLLIGAAIGLLLMFVVAPYVGHFAAVLPIVGAIIAVAASVALSKDRPPPQHDAATSHSAAIEGVLSPAFLGLMGFSAAFFPLAYLPAL